MKLLKIGIIVATALIVFYAGAHLFGQDGDRGPLAARSLTWTEEQVAVLKSHDPKTDLELIR